MCMYVFIYVCMYVFMLPRPPLWGGVGVVCMYLRRLVGIGMYVCMYVFIYVCMSVCMYLCFPAPPVGWGGCSMYVPT